MKNIDEKYVIEKYADGSSTIQLAKELETYPKKIERILKNTTNRLEVVLSLKNWQSKRPLKTSN